MASEANIRRTSILIHKARNVLHDGKFRQCATLLRKLERVLQSSSSSYPRQQRIHQHMMLYLLQFNLHLVQGKPPKFLDINRNSMPQLTQVTSYIKRYKQSLSHSQQALFHLQRLIRYYTQQFPRTLRKEVRLESWFSLERDLKQDIRAGRFRIATLQHQSKVLKYMFHQTKRMEEQQLQGNALRRLQQQTKTAAQQQQSFATAVKAIFRKAQRERQRLQHDQRKMAKAIGKVQSQFVTIQDQLARQTQRAPIFLWSGVAGLVVGIGGLAAGIALHVEAGQNTQLAPREAGYLQRVGAGVAISGGVLSLLGGVSVLLGWSMEPGSRTRDRALLQAHHRYLDAHPSSSSQILFLSSP